MMARVSLAKRLTRGFSSTIDSKEMNTFSQVTDWWDSDGTGYFLRQYNNVRIPFIVENVMNHPNFGLDPKRKKPLDGLSIIDVGCGGGIAAEVYLS